MNGHLAVFNSHEPWVYQLCALGQPLDIITDLPGRHLSGWDHALRPLPPLSRLLSLAQAEQARSPYDAILTHSLSDLLDARKLLGPRLLIIHMTLDGLLLEQSSETDPVAFRKSLAEYVACTGKHVVAVSLTKGASWGFADDIVLLSADSGDYPPWQGDLARGLRISNFISRRTRTLLWDFHQRAFTGVPVTLVGQNPDMPGVRVSRDWCELKELLRGHRFYIHTAQPQLEDGYNMATLEAMAAGLPILGNLHPSSPVEHEVSGFLSDDPDQLRAYAELLLSDRQLAGKMGQAAQSRVREQFSLAAFRIGMQQAVAKAKAKWQQLQLCGRG